MLLSFISIYNLLTLRLFIYLFIFCRIYSGKYVFRSLIFISGILFSISWWIISINLLASSSKKSLISFYGLLFIVSNIPESLFNLPLIFSFTFDQSALWCNFREIFLSSDLNFLMLMLQSIYGGQKLCQVQS